MRELILPDYQNTDAYDLFLSAVKEFETASLFRNKKQHLELIKALQASANYFARALLTANGGAAEKNETNDELLSAGIEPLNDGNHPVYGVILDVISLESGNKIHDQPDDKIQDIFDRYRDALISGRKILVTDLKYNENQWKKIKAQLFTHAGLRQISFILIPLLIFITIPVAFYLYKEPVHNSNLAGEIFWKSKGDTPFTGQRSNRFSVTEGSQFIEYTIDLPEPADIYLMRVDPVHRKDLAEIEIEWIRLFGEEGTLLQELTSRDFKQWLCANCVKLPMSENNIFTIQVIDKDPFLTSTVIDQKKVKSVSIRMRILSKKTFWEWVLGIDT